MQYKRSEFLARDPQPENLLFQEFFRLSGLKARASVGGGSVCNANLSQPIAEQWPRVEWESLEGDQL